MSNIPPSLQRVGIESVSDNLPDDGRIDLPDGYIWGFFGEELQAAFMRPKDSLNDKSTTTANNFAR